MAYHHGDLRAALIAAALHMLEEGDGPTTLSLREAARRAGVSAMAPYRHFADKEALLAAAAMVGFQRLEAALREADQAPEPREALVAQGVAYVSFACANPALFRLMFGATLAERHGDLAKAGDAAFAVMAQRVAGLVGPHAQAPRALHCWALAHGLASLGVDGQLASRGVSPLALASDVLRLDAFPLTRDRPSV